jgi:hypothetical protein
LIKISELSSKVDEVMVCISEAAVLVLLEVGSALLKLLEESALATVAIVRLEYPESLSTSETLGWTDCPSRGVSIGDGGKVWFEERLRATLACFCAARRCCSTSSSSSEFQSVTAAGRGRSERGIFEKKKGKREIKEECKEPKKRWV